MFLLNTSGKRIRTLRVAAGLNQTQLADHIGIAQNTLSVIENDRIRLSVDLAKKLAEPLNTNPQYLLMLTDEYTPEPLYAQA